MMTRSKLGIVAVGLGGALLAACAPSTSGSEGGEDGGETTLEVWSWRTEDVDEYEKIFDAYEAEHEGVTVEFKPYVATEYDTILSTGLSAEGGPDVAQLRAYGGLQPLCEAGRLVELEAEDVDTSAISDDVLEGARCQSDGGLYGVPFASQALVVYYNKAIFEEHDLEEPETWDELMEIGTTLQEADVTPYAVTGKDNWVLPMLHDLFTAPRYGGPEFEEAVQSGEADFTDPDYVASIETMEEVTPYFPEDVVGVDYATAQTLFTSEKAAMYPGGSFELAFFQDQNPDLEMGVFPVPPPPGSVVDETLTPGWVDASFGVNSESPDKEEAVELVRWMATQDFGQMVSDELKQMNPVEGVEPSDPILQEISELYNASPTPYLLLQDFRYGEPTGTDLMAAGLQSMLLGDTDAQAVSEKLQKGVAQWFEPGA
ncbi:MAG TPA: extracellular solute-binding protein [Nocardioides sp.]|nr:extracellular solute-binding protein [Nocardioides sp.]